MLYYRFRPAGELALKELLYDELFLASTAECNDPYDGMPFLVFGPDYDKWHRFIGLAWDKLELPYKSKLISDLVNRVVVDCPLTYADATGYDYESTIKGLSLALTTPIAHTLALRITSLLELYRPRPPYFASFSRTGDNPLMWSHYASMHQGHCLIFRDLDGHLEQCPRRARTWIKRETTRGIATSMSCGVPAKFRFKDISYQDNTVLQDAFACLPEFVYGKELSEQERKALVESQQQDRFTKHAGWSYENEARITFVPGPSWLFGDQVECTPLERLLHFRPTQLVGLIMGARMPAQQRLRIREICKARLDRIAVDIGQNGIEDPFFDFVMFQSALLNDRRDLTIKPVEIFSLSNSYVPENEKFAERLERWREGWALVFRGNGTRKQQFG